jgi:hypothetical protein
MPQPTRQYLPGYFHSRLSAPGAQHVKVVIPAFPGEEDIVIAGINSPGEVEDRG